MHADKYRYYRAVNGDDRYNTTHNKVFLVESIKRRLQLKQ